VQLSIDDFGTGFSCLSSLRALPVQEIKIDKTFLRDIPDVQDTCIITAIIALAQQLSLKVVAEGVETAVQADFLSSASCDPAQGYLHAKPMPADAVIGFLHNRGAIHAGTTICR
jgi:EAL domain-containing protein (putative c-di-GMP-specific phosphodiesterase class I)